MLDPDGTLGDWLAVVVRAATGVVYEQEYGGTARRQGAVEGYLVQVGTRDPGTGRESLRELRALFRRETAGGGAFGDPPGRPSAAYERLCSAVASVNFWASSPVPDGEARRSPLAVDEERLRELDDAWVPVRTPDGPGVLLWNGAR
ncbi:DUF6210 family protein [Actinomadura rugatobispora]|uniref:DUF6210 family protein n=2 Tax=Actinomadura rugatobispora TaxID=1994 RepID=A0ABW1A685_9ACTN